MSARVIMPQLGESVIEGTVSRWLKQEGEPVEEYEPLLEVSTDKVDTEIPAPASGVLLRIFVQAGQTVEAGTLLAEIGAAHESQSDAPNGAHTSHVTPVVARMAAEHNLDLSQIKGTGRDGRITKRDVESYLESDSPAWERPGSGDLFKPTVDYESGETTLPPAPVAQATPSRSAPATPNEPGQLINLTPMRRAIAEHMVRSKLETAPHATTLFEIDMTAVETHRAAHKTEYASQGVRLTLTPYLVQAVVEALQAQPIFNAQWTERGIFIHQAQHIGIAAALEDGLIVPVIRSAQDLNLLGLARAVNDLAARARAKQLRPGEAVGGTFTISNHGVTGSLLATPIINQPQVGILGVGKVEKRVRVIGDAIAIRPYAYMTLTFDHRVADGAQSDAFMTVLKTRLENWEA